VASISATVTGASPITASVTDTQIDVSAGTTASQIDVSVTGGIGPSGSNGAAGSAATITVGSVTTGAAGTSASVTNVGTSSAAVFNFTIPAGATGPQGATGPAGSNASATTDASALTSGTLNASRLPTSGVAAGTYTSVTVDTYGRVTAGSTPAISYNDLTNRPTLGTAAAAATSDFAAASHAHGNITNAGAIGSTSGQIVVTTTSGVLTTAASIASSQVTGLATSATTDATNASNLSSGTVSESRLPVTLHPFLLAGM
jgi:hypothetical protein